MSRPDSTSPHLAQLDEPEAHLAGLVERFREALRLRSEKNDIDGASEILREILRVEPRLAEPRMELARILLDVGQFGEAEEQAREAIRILEAGGQWTDDLPENVVLSLAWNILAEALRRRADTDEVVFGDPDEWRHLVALARQAFKRAAELDRTNEHAAEWAARFEIDAPERDRPAAKDQ